jgi:Zn-dependent protease
MFSLLTALAVLAFLWAIPYLIALGKMYRIVFRCFSSQPTTVAAFPEILRTGIAPVIAELETYGFQVVGYYEIAPKTAADSIDWQVLLQHANGHTFAGVGAAKPYHGSSAVQVAISTFFTDGCQLITQNEPPPDIFKPISWNIPQYFATDSLGVQWDGHQTRLAGLRPTRTPQLFTPEEFRIAWQAHVRKAIAEYVQRKELVWVEPGERYRLALATALKLVLRSRQQSMSRNAAVPKPEPNALDTDAQIMAEVEEFYRQQQQRSSKSRHQKSIWLLGSLALFIACYAAFFQPQTLLLFMAVLLLHEGGHVLAMKWFGYRDAAMLFIPFLGALATARKENATLTEKVWISLAGPLPGLCLGIGLAIFMSTRHPDPITAMLAAMQSNWMREAALMLVALNFFNLLPVYPLDGGQVADLLIFSRNVYLGVIFKALGVGLLGLLGMSIHKPLLVLFAILIGLTIPASFRLNQLTTQLRQGLRSIPAGERTALVQFIFTQLQQPPYRTLSAPQKYNLVVALLDCHQEQLAPWTSRIGLTIVYLVSLITGLIGLLIAIMPHWTMAWSGLH